MVWGKDGEKNGGWKTNKMLGRALGGGRDVERDFSLFVPLEH